MEIARNLWHKLPFPSGFKIFIRFLTNKIENQKFDDVCEFAMVLLSWIGNE